jgi:cytochrome c oxidase subunit 3
MSTQTTRHGTRTTVTGKWLAHHFDTPVQQFESAKLGMWAFLAQEILFFSGLFVAYAIFRIEYPEAFAAGSMQLDKLMGGANTSCCSSPRSRPPWPCAAPSSASKKEVSRYLVITILCAFASW